MANPRGVRNPPSEIEGITALKEILDTYQKNLKINNETEKIAVKYCLELLHKKAPGKSVEVRIPPHAAIQVISGITHKRGTPPGIVEMSPTVFIQIAIGKTSWHEARDKGFVQASGERTDLFDLFPLINLEG